MSTRAGQGYTTATLYGDGDLIASVALDVWASWYVSYEEHGTFLEVQHCSASFPCGGHWEPRDSHAVAAACAFYGLDPHEVEREIDLATDAMAGFLTMSAETRRHEIFATLFAAKLTPLTANAAILKR